jgi:hypothetical protein
MQGFCHDCGNGMVVSSDSTTCQHREPEKAPNTDRCLCESCPAGYYNSYGTDCRKCVQGSHTATTV